ncbi:hypothetical protein ROZALSC1DRAFT_30587 [Rozella allomycis CSF55]|uniref:Uncharacterized protein n=1 Tax=Rozella allomycis (strain CSF55) TaxID=988480 RepID=A0A4P9YE49_ROZAC|nr:hypothetical protein ROZALSC1DRAFT_30587 [Rozella allomycis CSF55]
MANAMQKKERTFFHLHLIIEPAQEIPLKIICNDSINNIQSSLTETAFQTSTVTETLAPITETRIQTTTIVETATIPRKTNTITETCETRTNTITETQTMSPITTTIACETVTKTETLPPMTITPTCPPRRRNRCEQV